MVIIGLAWAACERRGRFPLRIVLAGLALQFALALALLKLPPFRAMTLALTDALGALERATQAGTSFVFGLIRASMPAPIIGS